MNNKKYYAGIGSRNTPQWVLDCMKNLGYCLSDDFIKIARTPVTLVVG